MCSFVKPMPPQKMHTPCFFRELFLPMRIVIISERNPPPRPLPKHGRAYSTARRTTEIGLRMALGAGRYQVLGLILRQVLRPVAAGTVVGLMASWAATRWIESLLFGVRRLDPLTLLVALSLLITVAIAAALVPAWRAAQVDPMTALRAE